ncbi:hypothetical protein [Actinospongicola halichondriae]|uniref:hypothetical protein n=1 Tax=Actinospongicola halichondriae TaxID=3236844 RepID=UPI003D485020
MKQFLTSDEPKPSYGVGFWVGLVLGVPVVAYGLWGLVDTFPGDRLVNIATYFVGGAVVHDLIVAPAVCVLGWLLLRFVPRAAVGPVQAAAAVSAVVALVAWPLVRGYGVTAGEPSFLSRDYTASVLVVWGVVWSVAALVVAFRLVSARRR